MQARMTICRSYGCGGLTPKAGAAIGRINLIWYLQQLY